MRPREKEKRRQGARVIEIDGEDIAWLTRDEVRAWVESVEREVLERIVFEAMMAARRR